MVVIVTFTVTFGIQYLVNLITIKKIEIKLGSKILIDSKLYQLFDVSNISKGTLSDCKLTIPQTTNIDSIISSNPITITILSNSNVNRLSKSLSISNIKASEITSVFIPIQNTNQTIEIISYDNIKVVSYNNPKSPIDEAMPSVLIYSIISSILIAAYSFYLFSIKDSLSKKIEKAEVSADKIKEKTETYKKDIDKTFAKLKALQNLKIIDYQKELEFWRNMIKNLLFDTLKKSFKDSEEIISKITEELKTFSTREKSNLDCIPFLDILL